MPPAKRSTSGSPKTTAASKPAAKRAGTGSRSTTKAAASGAKSSAAKPAAAKSTRAGTAAPKRASGAARAGTTTTRAKTTDKPHDVVTLTRERIQGALDEAASRGRVTRKDANELVAELMRRGRAQGDEVKGELGELLGRGRGSLEMATRKARKSQPVDRIVRGADRARRAAGVGPSFPITGYDELKVAQVQARIKDLSKPELRKVLTYERKNANRKSVVGALEKAL